MNTYFIGGAPRSGGTLLTSILCSDQTTNPTLREAHYLREMVRTYAQGKQLYNTLEGCHYFDDLDDLRHFSGTWVNNFLVRMLEKYTPASNLVFKSFLMSVLFPVVYELLPDARFLVSVRDPRDITCSQIDVGEKQNSLGQHVRFPRNAYKLARENLQYYLPSMTYQDKGFREKVLFIRYEDLVNDTSRQIDRIRHFTGLSLDDYEPDKSWTGGGRNFAADREAGDAYINELYGKGMTSSRIGRYRRKLTQDEIRTIEAECAAIFSVFGYEISGEHASN